jgi:hypothetical protein
MMLQEMQILGWSSDGHGVTLGHDSQRIQDSALEKGVLGGLIRKLEPLDTAQMRLDLLRQTMDRSCGKVTHLFEGLAQLFVLRSADRLVQKLLTCFGRFVGTILNNCNVFGAFNHKRHLKIIIIHVHL